MSQIRLVSGNASAVLDTNGAYVTVLKNGGHDILFPAQRIGEKLRGGAPVCAPIFGPGDAVELKQHGFARDVEWVVTRQSQDEITLSFNAMGHSEIPVQYRGCVMTYTVTICESHLALKLTIENRGNHAFVCSPGFHPYFLTNNAPSVTVQSDTVRQFSVEELAATQFLPPRQRVVAVDLGAAIVRMTSDTLQRYAVWSADPDKYICVEPTWAGNLADQTMQNLLQPGKHEAYEMTLAWL